MFHNGQCNSLKKPCFKSHMVVTSPNLLSMSPTVTNLRSTWKSFCYFSLGLDSNSLLCLWKAHLLQQGQETDFLLSIASFCSGMSPDIPTQEWIYKGLEQLQCVGGGTVRVELYLSNLGSSHLPFSAAVFSNLQREAWGCCGVRRMVENEICFCY